MCDIEDIRRELKQAFTYDVDAPFGCKLTREEFEDLRADLSRWEADVVLKALPSVMEDLLDNHPDHVYFEQADSVVRFLVSPEFAGKTMGSDESDVKLIMRLYRESLEVFSKQQATAIYHWLLWVRTWPDYIEEEEDEDQIWLPEIDDAIAYWERRATEVLSFKDGL